MTEAVGADSLIDSFSSPSSGSDLVSMLSTLKILKIHSKSSAAIITNVIRALLSDVYVPTYVGAGLKGITLVLVGLDLQVRETIHTDLVLLGP